ncbi:hypothetical protein CEXT_527911 [Caerostris extrusa]|uniref:Uncharacterized protein n=1 Tax=Caerostris extrusa TaxID=172846 RepID=A0AAV4XBY3_CAEEX|nr:hypothetical protein CEXT_527911 [Caerostris extrusa]
MTFIDDLMRIDEVQKLLLTKNGIPSCVELQSKLYRNYAGNPKVVLMTALSLKGHIILVWPRFSSYQSGEKWEKCTFLSHQYLRCNMGPTIDLTFIIG